MHMLTKFKTRMGLLARTGFFSSFGRAIILTGLLWFLLFALIDYMATVLDFPAYISVIVSVWLPAIVMINVALYLTYAGFFDADILTSLFKGFTYYTPILGALSNRWRRTDTSTLMEHFHEEKIDFTVPQPEVTMEFLLFAGTGILISSSALAVVILDAYGKVDISGWWMFIFFLLMMPPVIGIFMAYTASVWYEFLLLRWHIEMGPGKPYPEDYKCISGFHQQ
jgi:hypothetical protein